MLAEIFMVRLEATARAGLPQEPLPSSNSPFVPFERGGGLAVKDGMKRLGELTPDNGPTQHD
jgi:hypothetical protein